MEHVGRADGMGGEESDTFLAFIKRPLLGGGPARPAPAHQPGTAFSNPKFNTKAGRMQRRARPAGVVISLQLNIRPAARHETR